MKFQTTLVLLFLLKVILAGVDIQLTLSTLPGKYCPMRGLNGESFCPNGGNTMSEADTFFASLPEDSPLVKGIQMESGVASSSETPITIFTDGKGETLGEILNEVEKKKIVKLDNVPSFNISSIPRIVSGFGFDRVSREMKFPVYPTTDAQRSDHVANDIRTFENVHQFIDFAAGIHGHQPAGLYVRDRSYLRNIAMQFGVDSAARIGITQKTVRTHVTHVASEHVLPEFNEVINSLPAYNRHDPNSFEQYRMVIRFWGTDVAMNVEHGGTVYQQTIIKKCFGGNIHEGMLNDLDSAIGRRQPGSGYLQYRRLGVFEARGGNPEFGSDRMNERISTFVHAPAPIAWGVRGLWDAVSDPTRRQWLYNAIVDYINENAHSAESIKRDVAQAVENNYRGNRLIYPVNFNIEHWGNIVVRWTGCPIAHYRGGVYAPHCALLSGPFHMHANQGRSLGSAFPGSDTIVERNNEGHIRIRMVFNGADVFVSPFVRDGCVNVRQVGRFCDNGRCIDGHLVLFRAVCMDVLPHIVHYGGQHNQVQTRVEPVCQHY